MTRAGLAVVLVLALVTPAWPGGGGSSGLEGHPPGRFPLTISIGRFDDDVERAFHRAVENWNVVFRETLATAAPAFVVGQYTRGVSIAISPVNVFFAPATARIVIGRPASLGPAAETFIYADRAGLIHLPVRIDIRQTAAAFDEGTRESFFYRAIARELGRALGLPNVDDPRSLMCCVRARPDAAGAPPADMRSIRRQLAEHYAAFWARDMP